MVVNFFKSKINLFFFIFCSLIIIGTSCGASLDKKNIAFRRAVYQSSAADFNSTGHLLTDGIFTVNKQIKHICKDQFANSPSVETPEYAFDGKPGTKWLTFNNSAWLQIQFANDKSFSVVYYSVTSGDDSPERDPKEWTVEGSNDGINFNLLDTQKDQSFNKRKETKNYEIKNPGSYKYYRLNIIANRGDNRTQLSEWDLVGEDGKSVIERFVENEIFDSRWVSATNKNEWVYVDLGTVSKINEVKLYWFESDWASDYDIQLSDDAKNWETVYSQNAGNGGVESHLLNGKKARYIRLFCKSGATENFALVEIEVYGSNNISYKPEKMPEPLADGTQYLRGGKWKLQRATEVPVKDGALISKSGFNDNSWLPAKVPGTVLMSYLEAGAIPDPNYGMQQVLISDSYFTADFWYRNQFKIPSSKKGEVTWLNFDAINWKADVYFNGSFLGSIDGAFIRGRFDITRLANYGGENYLAVFIHKNDNPGPITIQTLADPGKNGGILGADNPTIHASVGWDWVPTIRGRNIGIYNDVYISYTQDVQIQNPWIITDLDIENKDFSKAALSVRTELSNSSNEEREVVVQGLIQPGNLAFKSQPITLQPKEQREVLVADLVLENPQLWWPVTYGDQFLYTATLTAYTKDKQSDSKTFEFGVREYTYYTEKPLTIYCNGTRIVCRGGNWGMDDSNLAATEEDYNIKVRLHADANLTMIRNWVGMTGNEAFYRACDKYGVLIWDDFWLANPGDGPNPNDESMFMRNARDKVKRNRHHAALALYCGRNEGNPPVTLDAAFDACTKELDGTRYYIPHSASGVVSGWGPYSVQDSEWYFKNTWETLHSERGMPNVPALESLQKFLPEENQWPIDVVWGIHDFTMGGAQGGGAFLDKMRRYGKFDDLETFARFAQMVNFEGHKSIFEAVYTNRGNGMLMWMSQSAWPSMVWQTYDYYYDTNGGYFGLKKGNQPVNAIFNFVTHEVVLSNATPVDKKDLTVVINVYDIKGKLIKVESYTKTALADTHQIISNLDLTGFSGVLFVKTRVLDVHGIEIADNFTWINVAEKYNYSEISHIQNVNLKANWTLSGVSKYGEDVYSVTVQNTEDSPALMIRIKTMNEKTKELVLPVYYQDNYFSLMLGESKTISVTIDKKYLNGSKPQFYMEGWNQKIQQINQ